MARILLAKALDLTSTEGLVVEPLTEEEVRRFDVRRLERQAGGWSQPDTIFPAPTPATVRALVSATSPRLISYT